MFSIAALGAVGCDAVYGLRDRLEPDAAVDDAAVVDVPAIDATSDARHISPGDFDADGVANDLDPCPLIAGQSGNDNDADGLPNACDPDLAKDRDCVVFFETFTDPLVVRWIAEGWTTTLCAPAGLCSPSGAAESKIYFNQPIETTRIEARFTILSITDDLEASVRMYARMRPDASNASGRACSLFRDGATANVKLVLGDFGAQATGVTSPDPATAYTNVPFTLRLDEQTTCSREAPAGASVTNALAPLPGDFIGVEAVGARISLRYIIGYGSCAP